MEWKDHIKAVIKDAMTNPTIDGDLNKYLDKRVELIMSFIPEEEKKARSKKDDTKTVKDD